MYWYCWCTVQTWRYTIWCSHDDKIVKRHISQNVFPLLSDAWLYLSDPYLWLFNAFAFSTLSAQYYCETSSCIRRKCSALLWVMCSSCWVMPACTNKICRVQDMLCFLCWKVLKFTPYSLELSLYNFCVFGPLQKTLKGHRCWLVMWRHNSCSGAVAPGNTLREVFIITYVGGMFTLNTHGG